MGKLNGEKRELLLDILKEAGFLENEREDRAIVQALEKFLTLKEGGDNVRRVITRLRTIDDIFSEQVDPGTDFVTLTVFSATKNFIKRNFLLRTEKNLGDFAFLKPFELSGKLGR